MAEIKNDVSIAATNLTLETFKEKSSDNVQQNLALQVASQGDLQEVFQEATNPFGYRMAEKKKKMSENKDRIKKAQGEETKVTRLEIAKIRQSAGNFEQRNPELKAKMLLLLLEQLKPDDKREEILRKVFLFYSDPALADEALQFLEETTRGPLQEEVRAARTALNDRFSREITASKNIAVQVREYSEKGLGSPTALRDLYSDITDNPREPQTLFQELSNRFAYKDLRKVIAFLLHSLGADLKAKGPSIEPGLLTRLFGETRSLQSILGVYTFFRGRMKLLQKLFNHNQLQLPKPLTFELLAKQFMAFAQERYPSGDKALRLMSPLGIDRQLLAKIFVLSQMRDAIRQVSVNQVYRSIQHRDDMLAALIEALEDLEDDLDEEEERKAADREEKEEEEEDLKINPRGAK